MPANVTLALAPFDNLSGNPGEDYLARGFVDDLAAELSRFGSFDVLYPRAVERFLKGEGQGLPAGTHLLRGSIRRAGDVLRVGVQLVDAASGRQIWAHRYDATAGELLTMQDEIASSLAGALALQIDGARLAVARRTPLASLEAYDCWLRGLDCLQRGTIEADAEARTFFERALAIDPSYARAHAGLSLTHFNEWSCQAWERWDEKERLAYEYASRAAEFDDSDATVQVVLARVLLYRRRYDEAAHHAERALALNPNDTDVLVQAAMCLAVLGDAPRALELTRKALRVNPSPPSWYLAVEAEALFLLGRYREATDTARGTPAAMVDLPAWIAASAALAGDHALAQTYVARFLEHFAARITFGRRPDPGEPLRWLLHVNPFRREADAAHIARGLRVAGLEADPDDSRIVTIARPAIPAGAAVFRRDGAFWTMAFDGLAVQLTDQKGFHDLARLLVKAGQEIHCLELADRPAELGTPVLDERARHEIQRRVRELQDEIDTADAAADMSRAARAREEMDQIVEILSGSLGLRGRSRVAGSGAERARSAVTWRIRSAIRKIAGVHPRLGRHLDNSVYTGTFCSYRPEADLRWNG